MELAADLPRKAGVPFYRTIPTGINAFVIR